MRNFTLLTRASSEEQGRHGNSHNSQITASLSSPRVAGWNCKEIISETISGTTDERKTYEKLYRKCVRNPNFIDLILVQKWSRFARNQAVAWHWIKKFRDIGIEINAVDQWINYGEGAANLMLGMYLGIAADESERTSRFIKDNYYSIQKDGFFCRPIAPRGWDKVLFEGTRRKTLVPSGQYEIVKAALQDYLTDLYSQAYLLKKYKSALGVLEGAFRVMLFHPAHAGLIKLEGYRHQTGVEYIIAKWNPHRMIEKLDYFELLQIKESRHRKRTQSQVSTANYDKYYLKGLLYSRAGKRMTASAPRGRSKNYSYYSCGTKGVSAIRAEKAHAFVIDLLSRIFDAGRRSGTVLKALKELTTEGRRATKRKLTEVNKVLESTLQRQNEIKKMFASGEITIDEYRDFKSDLSQIKLQNELDVADAARKVENMKINLGQAIAKINNIGERFEQADYEKKVQFLRFLFPEGFYLDLESGVVGTTNFNRIILQITDNEVVNQKIKPDKTVNSPFARLRVEDKANLEPAAAIVELAKAVRVLTA